MKDSLKVISKTGIFNYASSPRSEWILDADVLGMVTLAGQCSASSTVPSRHRRDSFPGMMEVGGFLRDFEPLRTASSDRDASSALGGREGRSSASETHTHLRRRREPHVYQRRRRHDHERRFARLVDVGGGRRVSSSKRGRQARHEDPRSETHETVERVGGHGAAGPE